MERTSRSSIVPAVWNNVVVLYYELAYLFILTLIDVKVFGEKF